MEISNTQVVEIKQSMIELSGKIEDMYAALMGDKMTKDGGLIKRLVDAELFLIELEQNILRIEKESIKINIYVNIIYLLAGSLLSLAIGAFVNYLIKTSTK